MHYKNQMINIIQKLAMMKYFFLYFLFAVFFISCHGGKTSKVSADANNAIAITIPNDTLKKLLSLTGADSTLTQKQLDEKGKLMKIMNEFLRVEKNHFLLLAKPQDFEKVGLSRYYYGILKKNIEEVNSFVDSENIQNLEEQYKNGSLKHGFDLLSTEKGK